jgi:RimJ/RimL family protein N-acetyltransferase
VFDTHFSRGLASAQSGRWGEAVRSFTRSVLAHGPEAAVLYNLGIAQWQLARHDEARACFVRARRLAPADVRYRAFSSRLVAWCGTCEGEIGVQYLEAGGLRATPLGPHHSHALWHLQQDPDIVRLAGIPRLESAADTRRWLKWQGARRQTLGLIEPEHGLVGAISLARREGTGAGDMGHFYYWVGSAFRRRGFGRRALDLLIDLAVRSGVHTLWSVVRNDNEPSRRLLLAAGFECGPPSGTAHGVVRVHLNVQRPCGRGHDAYHSVVSARGSWTGAARGLRDVDGTAPPRLLS